MVTDPYYDYANNCLKNKLGITDSNTLHKLERDIVRQIINKGDLPKGNFDYEHLKDVHKHLFKDIYSWAGQERTVGISKVNMFCIPRNITSEIHKTFAQLKNDNHLKNINDQNQFVEKISKCFSDINAIHPFREGNGRATRVFFSYLAKEAGYKLDFSKVNKKEWFNANIESFIDNTKLTKVFARITTKTVRKRLQEKSMNKTPRLSR